MIFFPFHSQAPPVKLKGKKAKEARKAARQAAAAAGGGNTEVSDEIQNIIGCIRNAHLDRGHTNNEMLFIVVIMF